MRRKILFLLIGFFLMCIPVFAEETTVTTTNALITTDAVDVYENIADLNKVDCSVLGLLRKDLDGIFNLFKIVAPILMIIMSTYDFIRAITGKVEGDMKKAFQKLLKRMAFAVILFFLPVILDFFLGLIDSSYSTCISHN